MNDSKQDGETGMTFEQLLADPNEQFDKRSELLASIEAYAKAVPATASGLVCTCPETAPCQFHAERGSEWGGGR